MTPAYAKEVERRQQNIWRAAAIRQNSEMRAARTSLSLEKRRKLDKPSKHGAFSTKEEFDLAAEQWWKEHASILFMPQPEPPAPQEKALEPRAPRDIPTFMRDAILISEPTCVYCRKAPSATLDHIHPYSRGGQDTWLNLVGACQPCNQQKNDSTLEELGWPQPHTPRLSQPDGIPEWFHKLPLVCFHEAEVQSSNAFTVSAFRVRIHDRSLVFEAIRVPTAHARGLSSSEISGLPIAIPETDVVVKARMHKKVRLVEKRASQKASDRALKAYRPQLKTIRMSFPGLTNDANLQLTDWMPITKL